MISLSATSAGENWMTGSSLSSKRQMRPPSNSFLETTPLKYFSYSSPSSGVPSARSGLTSTAQKKPIPLTSLTRSEEHTSELQSRQYLVCRLLLEKKKQKNDKHICQIKKI